MKTVKEILEKKGSEIISVGVEDAVAKAVLKLTQHKIGAVLVLDDTKKIKGILSERDIIRHFAGRTNIDMTIDVTKVMTKEVTCVKPDQSPDACMQLMTSGRFRHLPVVDNEELVGLVSIGDIVKAVMTDKELKIGELEYFISNTY
ncbi:MAG: CBS domain-containing protein [Spirochaetota bacterium]